MQIEILFYKLFWKLANISICLMPPWPRPKRTTNTDAMADECAKNNGYFCCDYYGYCRQYLVYNLVYSDSRDYYEGPPRFVLVRNGVARFIVGFYTLRYIENLRERKYDKGFEIIKRWRSGSFLSEIEKENADAVKLFIQQSERIDLRKILSFVELAERLKMRLKYSFDGYNHYLELI